MEIELTLVWAIIVTVGLVILLSFLIRNHMKYESKLEAIKFTIEKERTDQQFTIEKEKVEMQEQFKVTVIEERKDAIGSSRHTLKGRIGEQMSPLFPEFYSKYEPSDARFLGSPIDYIIFKHMSEYDHKTKAEDVPIDVVLVEVKSAKKAGLTQKEKAVRLAVKEGRVSFDVVRQNIEPQKEQTEKEPIRKKLTREERLVKYELQKIEAKKKDPSAYEPWTKTNDEFLINYWSDESNKRNRDEMIQELAEKLRRSNGGIKARLKRKGLIE